jgi:two-component system alkaline phosphatase synthesis response regulator PhoP
MAPQKSILVVDDEQDIVDLLKYNLQREGYLIYTARDGKDALEQSKKHPSLILLDVMMPELNGIEVLKQLKKNPSTQSIPVVFLTAKGSEIDEIIGLELGADDYIAKPISIPKLVARIKNVLRKSEIAPPEVKPQEELTIGVVKINRARHSVIVNRQEIFFPKKEFAILTYLATYPGEVITRERLLNIVWGQNVFVIDRTIDVHIRKIREKLGKYADYIETIKGIGYRMKEIL